MTLEGGRAGDAEKEEALSNNAPENSFKQVPSLKSKKK